MRYIFAILIMVCGIISSLYISIWWGVIEPVMTISTAITDNTITAELVGWEFVKFFCREILAAIVLVSFFTLVSVILKPVTGLDTFKKYKL